jgi:hypothetical protein
MSALILGEGRCERRIQDCETWLQLFRSNDGYVYYDYQLTSPADHIVPEDLAVTLLVNSRANGKAFKSVQQHGPGLDLRVLPDKPLEETSEEERRSLAHFLSQVAKWDGFKASIATKVLHKKRPQLIPILDNQAIFGAYMNPAWPENQAKGDSESRLKIINKTLNSIANDLTRQENYSVWRILQAQEPSRSLMQIFDSVWWMYFDEMDPERRRRREARKAKRAV